MESGEIELRDGFGEDEAAVLELYRSHGWSSAGKPAELLHHLRHSHRVVSAWRDGRLVGLGNTLSDGRLVAYYSHLLVAPEFQGRGIGTRIVRELMRTYEGFHQQVLVADGKAVDFYRKLGFGPAGETRSMWIFQGDEH